MLSWLKRQEQRLEAGNLTISCSRRSPMHNTVGYGSCHRLACCHSAATERTRTRWGRDTAPELTLGGSLPRAEPHGAPLPQHSQCCNGDPVPIPCALFFAEWEYLTAFWDALLITLALTYDTQISYLSHFHPVLSKADKCQTSQLFGSWLAWVQP